MSDTVVITVAVDKPLIGKSSAIQWPGVRTGLQAATPSTDGIDSVMFTYRFMEDEPAGFTDVQGSEAEPCAGGRASTDTVNSAVKVTSTDEGRTADDNVPTAAEVCPEAQLMAGNSVFYLDDLNDKGPVVRLLQWVAGICGCSWDFAVHGCPEGQLMACNSVVYLDDDLNDKGPVVRLLQWVAGICGGSWDYAVHGCPEAQLMAGNETIYQNGLVQWLLR